MIPNNHPQPHCKNTSVVQDIGVLWGLLDEVKDPEIPVLSIRDLGILRAVDKADEKIVISITPTYSGCPAMDVIRDDIKQVLAKAGYVDIEIKTVLSPAWTTDWMTDTGKKKLKAFGIVPPCKVGAVKQTVICPRCRSNKTTLVSEFGSTACKSMYRCDGCEETFCYFKAI